MGELKDKTVKGVFWSAFNRFSTQGIQFAFTIIIARILLPEDYGVVAILGIFIEISNCFIDSGFANALIRKLDRTEDDFSTAFYYTVAVSVLFYVILWFSAPYIARFYDLPILVNVTRVMGLCLIIGSIQSMLGIKLTIDLDYKTISKISLPTNILTGILGLLMAYKGFGVWTLILPNLIAGVFKTFLLLYYVRWIPKRVFSWNSFKDMFGYGSKLLLSSLLEKIFGNLHTIIIGKFFTPSLLGVYNRAGTLAAFPSSNVTSIIQSVSFPVLSRMQNDKLRLQSAYRRFMRMSVFIIFPLMLGLSSVADPFIRVLLTDKWAVAIYYLQIICFSMMWYPVHSINLSLLHVNGRSDYFLKLQIIKKIQTIIILCITVPMGIAAICYGGIVDSLLSLIWNTKYTKKSIGYGIMDQLRDIIPFFLHSLVMFMLVHAVIYFINIVWLKLLIGIIVGAIYYILGAYMMKFEELSEALVLLKLKKS